MGNTWLCSGLIPGSAANDHSLDVVQGSTEGLNLGSAAYKGNILATVLPL